LRKILKYDDDHDDDEDDDDVLSESKVMPKSQPRVPPTGGVDNVLV